MGRELSFTMPVKSGWTYSSSTAHQRHKVIAHLYVNVPPQPLKSLTHGGRAVVCFKPGVHQRGQLHKQFRVVMRELAEIK